MANKEHLNLFLTKNVEEWNSWREEIRRGREYIRVDLSGESLNEVDFTGADLSWVDFSGSYIGRANFNNTNLNGADLRNAYLESTTFLNANLSKTDFSGANLIRAKLINADSNSAIFTSAVLTDAEFGEVDLRNSNFINAQLDGSNLRMANLTGAKLRGAKMNRANLQGAHFVNANLSSVNLYNADLSGADLTGAKLIGANLSEANLSRCNLKDANLECANLSGTNFSEAILEGVNLKRTILISTNFNGASIENCKVYGLSAWDLKGKPSKQRNLIITADDKSTVSVDDLQVAQFIYLLLNRENLRDILNTITSKGVLILGRFTQERKLYLDAMADELNKNDLVPIIFDFDRIDSRDFTETIKTLAGISLFIIADITSPRSSPLELQATVPDYQIPFVPIIQEGEEPFSMLSDLIGKYNWVIPPVITYKSKEHLLKAFKEAIIDRAWSKHQELQIKKTASIATQSIEDFIKKAD